MTNSFVTNAVLQGLKYFKIPITHMRDAEGVEGADVRCGEG